MRDWIAGAMAVLGVLLVLAGAGVVVLKAMRAAGPPAPASEPAGGEAPDATVVIRPSAPSSRLLGVAQRVQAADRLIAWGTVLLVLAAVATGAISFHFGVDANSVK
jgi:hypothetical protein